MAHVKRGRIWGVIRNSPGIQIAICFLAFIMLIALHTYIFQLFYPLLENKSITWASALLFVVQSMTTVGYGEILPFDNDLTMLLSIQIILSALIMIFVVIPLLLAPFLTTLMTRNLNPLIRILSRANEPATVEKLYRAGADYVALIPKIGGQTITRIILAKTATILLELANSDLVILKHTNKTYAKPIKGFIRKTGVRINGIESQSRSIIAPEAEEIILQGDALIAVGNTEQLKKFIHLV
ncbi:MAG: ion channel [Methanoregula sp.]|nr:ion channel [Methanoregula sp.]